MNPEIIVTVLCGLAILVGVAGIVIPVLPGSILIGLSLLAWALWGGAGTTGWVVFGVGLALVLAGMAASAVLTGRKLKEHRIPSRSVVTGLVFGVAGMFLIPVVGLFVGFAAGLLLSESHRTRDFRTAMTTSWAALKATGVGMLVGIRLPMGGLFWWPYGAGHARERHRVVEDAAERPLRAVLEQGAALLVVEIGDEGVQLLGAWRVEVETGFRALLVVHGGVGHGSSS